MYRLSIGKSSHSRQGTIGKLSAPHARFDHVNVDIVCLLPPSLGLRYLLTVVDQFTRWPEAVPVSDATGNTCAGTFLANWVARFGIPSEITTDQSPQFTAKFWEICNQHLGVRLYFIIAYHTQANRLVERFHKHLKSALVARLSGNHWVDVLPRVLLGISTIAKEELQCSPAELVYGTTLTVLGDLILPKMFMPATSSFLSWLKNKVAAFQPTAMSRRGSQQNSLYQRD